MYIFLFAGFFLFSFPCFSQAHFINGKVVDSAGNPIEFANVVIKDQNGKIVEGTITDQKGVFRLKAKEGTYKLTISFLGYENWDKEMIIDKNQDLGIIALTESKSDLGEVIVTAEKPVIEKKVDRLVFNVEHSISASSGTVLDALRKTPGVAVDQDGAISMIGKGGVSVLIDDRMLQLSGEDLTNFLQSIASDDVKSIEVITTPPAKYEAEGSGGLINIQYKKGRKNAWNNSLRAAYTQATYPSYSLGNAFSYRKNKLRLFVSADAKTGSKAKVGTYKVYFNKLRLGNRAIKKRTNSFSGRFGLDYDLSSKSLIGMQYLGGFKIGKDYTGNYIYDGINSITKESPSIISNGVDDEETNNHSINLHYLQRLDSIGNKFSMDLDYFTYYTHQDKDLASTTFSTDITKKNQTKLDKILNVGDQRIENYSAKIDAERPTSWAKISYGAKTSFTRTNNLINYQYYSNSKSSDILKLDSTQIDLFIYTENTQAAYIDFAKELGKKWTFKLGLRAEYTQTTTDSQANKEKNQKRKYLQWFPILYALHTINDRHSLNLNYNRRINRPEFWALDPFRQYLSNVSYTVGNPFLQHSFTDKIELSHNYKNKFISTVFFSTTTDGFFQVPVLDNKTNEQIYTTKNYYIQYQYGASESYAFQPFSWWDSHNKVNLYYSKNDIYPGIDAVAQNGIGIYLSSHNSLALNTKKTIQGEINFILDYSDSYAAINQYKLYHSLDLGLNMFFLDKQLQGSIAFNDVLKSLVYRSSTFTIIKEEYNNYIDSQQIKFSLKYNFGNNTISVKKRAFGNKEEKNRAN